MKHKSTAEITRELLAHTSIDDEYLYRQLATRLIQDLPLPELKKLMKCTKVDPNTEENLKKLNSILTPEYERIYLRRLYDRQVIAYEVEIDT